MISVDYAIWSFGLLLEIALLVREVNPQQRVVLRMADPHLAQTLREAANVRLALSTSAPRWFRICNI